MTAGRERVRQHRRRQRLGLDVLRIEADRWLLADWLIRQGRLAEEDAERPGRVEAAVSRLIAQMIRQKL